MTPKCLNLNRCSTYHAQMSQVSEQERQEYILSSKQRVVRLVLHWTSIYGELLQEEEALLAFLEVSHCKPPDLLHLSGVLLSLLSYFCCRKKYIFFSYSAFMEIP